MSRRNERIKPAGMEVEYTPEQIMELKRCTKDPIYFIRKYVLVQHPVKGSIPFDLYPYQERMIRAYQTNRFNCVLSSRQTGKCGLGTSKLSIINKPRGVKKIILWLIDKKKYNEIYKHM